MSPDPRPASGFGSAEAFLKAHPPVHDPADDEEVLTGPRTAPPPPGEENDPALADDDPAEDPTDDGGDPPAAGPAPTRGAGRARADETPPAATSRPAAPDPASPRPAPTRSAPGFGSADAFVRRQAPEPAAPADPWADAPPAGRADRAAPAGGHEPRPVEAWTGRPAAAWATDGQATGSEHSGPPPASASGRRSGRRSRYADHPGPTPGTLAAEGPPGDPASIARNVCLRLLTATPRTRSELATKLAERDIPDEVADTVLDRLTEVGLIDDAAYAEAWVSSRQSGRGLARKALAQELRRRGVDDEIVQGAVEQVEPEDEVAAARALVAKRLPATRRVERDARVRRLVGMLGRRGYPSGLALKVVHEALASEGEPQ